jgi:hypothetical protein
MQITSKAGLQPVVGPADYFPGRATVTGQFQREEPARVSGAIVHFEPGVRTAWHTHPVGQTPIVTEGVGWTQVEGGPVQDSTPETSWSTAKRVEGAGSDVSHQRGVPDQGRIPSARMRLSWRQWACRSACMTFVSRGCRRGAIDG